MEKVMHFSMQSCSKCKNDTFHIAYNKDDGLVIALRCVKCGEAAIFKVTDSNMAMILGVG